jgi:hypothetical protein
MAWLIRSGHISCYVATVGVTRSGYFHLHGVVIGPEFLPQGLLLERAREFGLGSGHQLAASQPSRRELDVRVINSADHVGLSTYVARNALGFARHVRSNPRMNINRIRPITRSRTNRRNA